MNSRPRDEPPPDWPQDQRALAAAGLTFVFMFVAVIIVVVIWGI